MPVFLLDLLKKSGTGPEFFSLLRELSSAGFLGAVLKNDEVGLLSGALEFKSNRTVPAAGSLAGVVVTSECGFGSIRSINEGVWLSFSLDFSLLSDASKSKSEGNRNSGSLIFASSSPPGIGSSSSSSSSNAVIRPDGACRLEVLAEF